MTDCRGQAIVSVMNETIDKRDPAVRAEIARRFAEAIPHNHAIGLVLEDASTDTVRMRLGYREVFLGDIESGLWHTGITFTAADSACGLAVFLKLPGLEAIATLDLRMDHHRPAVADKDLIIEAYCHHVTQRMAFVTADLYQDARERCVARATATFTRTGRSVLS